MFKRILIAVDGGEPALAAVKTGGELGEQIGASIILLHVVDTSSAFMPELGILNQDLLAELKSDGLSYLTRAVHLLPDGLKIERLLLEGEPVETIISTARDEHADAIILGSDSRGRLAHFLLGSTADAVIRRANCPVITVRALPAENKLPREMTVLGAHT
jgi:nucleotide-binding universal stress UspA family protein